MFARSRDMSRSVESNGVCLCRRPLLMLWVSPSLLLCLGPYLPLDCVSVCINHTEALASGCLTISFCDHQPDCRPSWCLESTTACLASPSSRHVCCAPTSPIKPRRDKCIESEEEKDRGGVDVRFLNQSAVAVAVAAEEPVPTLPWKHRVQQCFSLSLVAFLLRLSRVASNYA